MGAKAAKLAEEQVLVARLVVHYTSVMVKSCCAPGCKNRSTANSSIKFHRFPVDKDRRALWIAAVRRVHWQPTEHSVLCSAHFVSGSKSNDPLSPDYVPTLFNHSTTRKKTRAEQNLASYTRRLESRKRRSETAATRGAIKVSRTEEEHETELTKAPENEKGTMTERTRTSDAATLTTDLTLTTDKIEYIDALEKNLCHLRVENAELRDRAVASEAKRCIPCEECFKDDDHKVKFYTGLPTFSCLTAVFRFVSADVNPSKNPQSLPLLQQFLLVLMKLRLSLYDNDLAYRFGISQSTVSRYVNKWIDIMFVRFQPLIKWPTRDQIRLTMPTEFRKNFRNCVSIIDCFEIFCEKSKSLEPRAQTWSSYKHHNTFKFLIAISPQGTITFVSKAWGGRTSDQYITENCGILDNLLPGDEVLADRGFNVEDAFRFYCAKIATPPFTRGKKQLSKLEVDTARQLSRVRIHVERVIGLFRQKYTISQGILPINNGDD